MGRRKIEIKAIKDDRNRSVTFLKRKGGLFKKAHELSVLCSVDVAVIIFGHNKKLYEFSSGDIRETIDRYHYYGPPHEHKGPNDFAGKGSADDDDDDDVSPGPEDMGPQTQAIVPPHLQNQPGFQHINHAPSASPPIPNGVGFDPRHGTPQPQVVSRPTSRNHIRSMSSNFVNHAHPHAHATPPPPAQNGFAYMPNPSIYNPNVNPNLNHQPPRSTQYQQFAHPHPHPHPHPGPPHQTPPQLHPAQSMPPHHQPPHPHHLAQQMPHHGHGMQQPSHQQMSQVAQSYMQDQGRHSMPPGFPPEQQQSQPPPPPQQRSLALPDPSAQQQYSNQIKSEGSQSPRTTTSKSRSIFTPIDDQSSVFARNFGPHMRESPQHDASVKQEPPKINNTSQSVPVPPAATAGPPPPTRSATDPQRAQSTPSMPDIPPPSRTNSAQVNAKRPRLKVQIPSEQSDAGSATADSSPRDSAGHKTTTPAKVTSDTSHTGVVLPPPSPSAGALLSAGAQGPPNPFARPAPPGTNSQNTTSYGSSNMDTPISALPSRFVSDALLPSPSSFFPEWGFGRSGPDTNMLPSPLTFPTPSVQTGPGFAREDELDKKRKSSDGGVGADAPGKKLKT